MIPFDEIRTYLPKYLSPAAEDKLFEELSQFPANIDNRMYTESLLNRDMIFQGDGIPDLVFYDPPNPNIKAINCMILSNTCDVDPQNPRFLPSAVCYAPLLQIETYKRILSEEGMSEEQIASHVSAIKKQRNTGIFFLPKGARLTTDSLVLLDRICHCSNEMIDRKSLAGKKLFVLSDYGAYLFLLKISIHFTRITDKVQRSKASDKV